jgi:folate-binding Fe-S cluster repair protein YgfZ
MHYRGKAKKRLYLLEISAESSPEKNMLIRTVENKPVGEIIDVAVLAKNKYQVLAIATESIKQALKVQNLNNSELTLIPSILLNE